MRTNLVFKFFTIVLLLSGIVFTSNAKMEVVPGMSDQGFAAILPVDTLVPGVEEPLDPVAETPNDTILETPAEESDTLEPERQTGSAVILDARVDYAAKDSIIFDIRNQMVHLYGDADLQYGDIYLKAAYVNIDFSKKELFAVGMPDSIGEITGSPVFEEGGQSFESKELRYNFETKKGFTRQVITEEADGYMHGDVVKMMDDQVIHVSSGKYTTCDNPDPHFHISFRRAKVIPQDKIVSSLAYLTIAGVRTPLFVPFGFFPNTQEQSSGILIPSYGETNNRGFYLENGGFYWGISDYIDLSLRGDIYSRGSWAARLGSNYRKRYKYSGSLNVNYAINILGERNLPGYERNRDFRVVWNHSQDPKAHPNSVFRANVNAGSSQYNRFNPTTSQDYLSNTFSSNISYSANWAGRYNLSVNARHSQNTLTESVDLSLPEVAFSVARFHPFRRKNPEGRLRWYEEITMNYNMNASNQITTTEEEMFTSDMFSNMKTGVQHSIPLSHSFRVLNHFNLSNSLNYTERWYFEKFEQRWESTPEDANPDDLGSVAGRVVTDTIPGFYAVRDFNYSTSLNTRLYGMMQFRRGPITALRHVASPSIGFSFRPDFADPFWGYYDYYEDPNRDEPVRYSHYQGARYGTPPAGRSGAINFSLSNNLEMKVRSNRDTVDGERKIALIDNLRISTSYDLARDSLNLSDIRISGRTRLFGQFDVTYSSSWSPYAVDEDGRPIDKFLWETDKRLLQMNNTSWSLNFNYTLSSDMFGGEGGAGNGNGQRGGQSGGVHTDGQNAMPGNGEDDPALPPPGSMPNGAIDYSVPWSLRFSYSFNYNSRVTRPERFTDRDYLQNLNFSGDVNLTSNWRIGFSSGYNFEEKEITYTSIDVYRDLHCWEFTVNWIPFGFRQSYNFTIRVKSSVLQDLKLSRRTHHLDRAFN